jgi:cell division protein FtsB
MKSATERRGENNMSKMRIITLEECIYAPKIQFYCIAKNTKNGFMHKVYAVNRAVKTPEGKNQVITARVSYLNRTWERFEFETAIKQAIRKMTKNYLNTAKTKVAKMQKERFNDLIASNCFTTQELPDFENYIKAGLENF